MRKAHGPVKPKPKFRFPQSVPLTAVTRTRCYDMFLTYSRAVVAGVVKSQQLSPFNSAPDRKACWAGQGADVWNGFFSFSVCCLNFGDGSQAWLVKWLM